MPSLYKYIPATYAQTLVQRGELLFRNLTYFRQYEGRVRGDPYEGIHKDHPGTERVIRNLTRGFESRGAFALLHSTNSDNVFAFCLSRRLDEQLARDFGSDTAIEFFEPEELIRRIRFKLRRVLSVHKAGVLAKPVTYYKPEDPALFNVEEPKNLAFVKNEQYRAQDEFRIVFGDRKAFKLTRQVAQSHHDPYDDVTALTPASRLVTLGDLSDITRVVDILSHG